MPVVEKLLKKRLRLTVEGFCQRITRYEYG
jgi:hypothetical protein